MSKKQRILNMVQDWLNETPKSVAATYHINRIQEYYGVDLHATLSKMTYAELSVLLCCMVAQNAKAHDDARKWNAELKASKPLAPVIHLKLVKGA